MDERLLDRNHQGYAELDRAFAQAGMAGSAHFLNWGYLSVPGVPDAAPGPSDATPNAMGTRLVVELIGAASLDGESVLDVDCGRGGALAVMNDRFSPRRLVGVDLSPENIVRARAAVGDPRVRLQVADACHLPQADRSHSVVFNLESSGAYPRIDRFFRHVARILGADGLFLYGDLWPKELLPVMQRVLAAYGLRCDHMRDVTRQVLAAREAVPAALAARLGEGQSDLFAAPGSTMWAAMAAGDIVYVLGHWRKGPADPDALDTGDIALVNGRRTWIDNRLARPEPQGPQTSEPGAWFRFGAPREDARVNVFAFPYAAGGASVFRNWAGLFPRDWAFSAVQFPGREDRIKEPAIDRIEAAAAALVPQLLPYRYTKIVLLGWSLGAKLAFEVARQLEGRAGKQVALLVTGACPAPERPIAFASHSVRDYLQRLQGTPEAVLEAPDMLRALEPGMLGDMEMARHYEAHVPVRAPILALEATEDAVVPPACLAGWRRYSTASFRQIRIAGDHFALRSQATEIARAMEQALEQVTGAKPATWLPFDAPVTGAKPRLLLLHHAGGAARFFARWKTLAPLARFHLSPVELPGHGSRSRETVLDCPGQIAAELFRNLAPILSQPVPVFIFGHSLGALLGFLLASHMERAGFAAAGLIVSARRAPQVPTPTPHRHNMATADLLAQLKQLGGTDEAMIRHPEFTDLFTPVIRADFRITETYRFCETQKIQAPIRGFLGAEDTEVTGATFDAWAQATEGPFSVRRYRGGHFYLDDTDVLDALSRDIADFIDAHSPPRSAVTA